MSGFDVIVRLFALVLGFSIAEVLGGFARTLRIRLDLAPVDAAEIRVGWLVPLLGLLVVLDQMSAWLAFYILQAYVPLHYISMLAVLLLVGGFYIVSTLVFPAHPEKWHNFDDHYFRVKQTVIGGLVAIHLATIFFGITVFVDPANTAPVTGTPGVIGTAASIAFLPLLVVLFFAKRPKANLVVLLLAIACLLAEALSVSR